MLGKILNLLQKKKIDPNHVRIVMNLKEMMMRKNKKKNNSQMHDR